MIHIFQRARWSCFQEILLSFWMYNNVIKKTILPFLCLLSDYTCFMTDVKLMSPAIKE